MRCPVCGGDCGPFLCAENTITVPSMTVCCCANPVCLEKGCQLQANPTVEFIDLAIKHNEAEVLRARLRETAQILIAAVGADGPMDAEEAARKAVERIETLRALADEKAAEAGLCARRMSEAQERARRATAEERARIVTWLLQEADIEWEPASLQIARSIKGGDHLRKAEEK